LGECGSMMLPYIMGLICRIFITERIPNVKKHVEGQGSGDCY
jgi:hypothetical protein